jgi:hypothetical protein
MYPLVQQEMQQVPLVEVQRRGDSYVVLIMISLERFVKTKCKQAGS